MRTRTESHTGATFWLSSFSGARAGRRTKGFRPSARPRRARVLSEPASVTFEEMWESSSASSSAAQRACVNLTADYRQRNRADNLVNHSSRCCTCANVLRIIIIFPPTLMFAKQYVRTFRRVLVQKAERVLCFLNGADLGTADATDHQRMLCHILRCRR